MLWSKFAYYSVAAKGDVLNEFNLSLILQRCNIILDNTRVILQINYSFSLFKHPFTKQKPKDVESSISSDAKYSSLF